MRTAALRTVETLINDAAWLPHFYDARTDAFVFAHLPRDEQRRFVFLDPRFLADVEKSAFVPVRDLPLDSIRAVARPAHFIFHTAFCCSTLLARALDIPGVAMGLKEPSVLSRMPPTIQRPAGAPNPLELAVDLLSRPLAPGETQVIKPSNAANPLAGRILEMKPETKVLILHSDLDAYLRSSARLGATGRLFNRQMFAQLATSIPLKQKFTSQELLLQTDLQIAAQVWLVQAAFLSSVAKRFGPSRVRTLNSKTLIKDKVGALTRLGHFFGLNLDAGCWAEIASGPVFDRHAKRLNDEPYDPAANERADSIHAKEIEAILPWATALAAHCAAPLEIGDSLFD